MSSSYSYHEVADSHREDHEASLIEEGKGSPSRDQSTTKEDEVYRVYRFKPSRDYPSILFHTQPEANGPVSCVIRKPVLLSVVEILEGGIWWRVRWYNKEAWLQGLDPITRKIFPCLVEVSSYRRYEAWQGRNAFYCRGKVMLGSDANLFFFTNIMIMAPALVYIILVAPYIGGLWGLMLQTAGIILAVSCMAFLWKAALQDPGIIPPQPSWIKVEPPIDAQVGLYGWKYCETCSIFRPPRAKHCASCNVCILKMDHHCPWTGNCVGLRNYKSFVLFVMTLTMLTALVLSTSLYILIQHLIDTRDIKSLGTIAGEYPAAAGLAVFTFLMLWSLASLCGYHLYLICIGQTTNEAARGIYRDRFNEHDLGCWKNCLSVFCRESTPPSLLPDFNEVIDVEPPRDEADVLLSGEEKGEARRLLPGPRISSSTSSSQQLQAEERREGQGDASHSLNG